MRRLKRVEKRKPGDFRLLLRLGVDVNVARFKKHIARLQHRLYWDLALRQIKIKSRRRRRAEKPAIRAR